MEKIVYNTIHTIRIDAARYLHIESQWQPIDDGVHSVFYISLQLSYTAITNIKLAQIDTIGYWCKIMEWLILWYHEYFQKL